MTDSEKPCMYLQNQTIVTTQFNERLCMLNVMRVIVCFNNYLATNILLGLMGGRLTGEPADLGWYTDR